MDQNKIEKLIELLTELTDQKKLKWVAGTQEETYAVEFEAGTVSLSRRLNEENVAFNYFVEVLDEDGKKITSIVILASSALWNTVNSLFYAAQDKALDAEAIIDKILLELENAKFGF